MPNNNHETGSHHTTEEPESIFREYKQGQELSYSLKSIHPDSGATEHQESAVIEKVAGGGFFGKVLLLVNKDYVIKTSVSDPFHYFLRSMNWGHRLFPPQHSEIAAQRTVVASRLIAEVLPVLTNNKFVSPTVYGYAQFPEGFVYKIQKMTGRGPRYDTDTDEFTAFRNAQHELAQLAFQLGLEHVGQIHPDNPFSMANIWWDPQNKQFQWINTIPAIPHTGRVWPGVRYKFHDTIRAYFKASAPTFDKIHTEMFRQTIEIRREDFSEEDYTRIMQDLDFYDDLVASEQPTLIQDKKTTYYALLETLKEKPIHMSLEAWNSAIKLWKNPESFITRGIDEAYSRGYITEEEYQKVVASMQSQLDTRGIVSNALIYRGLITYYWFSGRTIDVIGSAIGLYAGRNVLSSIISGKMNIDDLGPTALQALIAFGIWFETPPILGYFVTKGVSKLTGKDMSVALSVIRKLPIRGIGYAGLIAQATTGTNNDTALHYQLRYMLAELTRLHPDGGWGTEREGNTRAKLLKFNNKSKKTKTLMQKATSDLIYLLSQSIPL